jgi:spoIIIJ-associated protein
MEWVETTGKTVEEAKARALDQLGVAEDDAEFELLDEPRAGLFGRMRGEARVRARVRPTQPRPKQDRRERRRGRGEQGESGKPAGGGSTETAVLVDATEVPEPSAGEDRSAPPKRSGGNRRRGGGTDGASAARPVGNEKIDDSEQKETPVDAQQVGDEAQKFVQGLVDAFGLTGTAALRRDGDDLEVAVEGSDLGLLVGPRGVTLQAIQELTRVAAQRRLGDHDTRLRVDVGGYRVRRREALTRFAQEQAAAVISEGKARILEPMSSADRKVIHDTLVEVEGVETRSEGDDPNRRVIIAPAGA